MKLKKSVLGFIILMLFVVGFGWRINNNLHQGKDTQEQMNYVNNKLKELSESSNYKESGLKERKEKMETILIELQQRGYITNLSYDEDTYLFSFQFSDGSLGGMNVKGFETRPGELPTN